MKLRIIFRGLILFRLEQPGEGSGDRLRALLINDWDDRIHQHRPMLRIIGRDETTKRRENLLGKKYDIAGQTITFGNFTGGVTKDLSFDWYVPRLSQVSGGKPNGPDQSLVAAEVIVPAGQIRAKRLVSWTHHFQDPAKSRGVETPVEIEFFSNPVWGPRPVANECVLEFPEVPGARVSLLSDARDSTLPKLLGAPERTGNDGEGGDMVEPDTVDVLVTNFAPQRSVAVPWSVHYQALFKAAGYPPLEYDEKRREAFVERAERYAGGQPWKQDVTLVEGWPIPHVSGLTVAPPEAFADPLNRPICPPAMEP